MDLIWRILAFFGYLREPDISPGIWFREYAEDWAAAHEIPDEAIDDAITSGIVEATNGWVWVTNTPSWDREWFESRHLRYPSRWVTWESIENAPGVVGEYLKLDI